ELVDATDGRQLWGARYDRRLAEILAVEEEIAREISERLKLRLTAEDERRLTKRHTSDTEAYQAYLRGRYYWNKRTDEWLRRGIREFERAIEIDPRYALAYAGLADSYTLLYNYYLLPPKESIPKAKEAAVRALEIDETLAEAHTSLAYALWEYDWDWKGAEREYRRAIELDPTYATAHHWYALFLASAGRFDEAMGEIRRARELDPPSLIINANVGMIHYFARRYDEAIAECRKVIEMDPDFAPARIKLGWAYHHRGLHRESVAEFEKVMKLIGDGAGMRGAAAYVRAAAGDREAARKTLGELVELSEREYVSPYLIATLYAGLGDHDRAFEWLDKALADRSSWMVYVKVEPTLDGLRTDPRFADLLRRTGLSP
ncbi:MAG: tetratricopeptide repeat protein, partial [Pyrinomonadaceae bacterium]